MAFPESGLKLFTAFSLETMKLMRSQRYFDAGLNILISNLLAIALVIAGFMGMMQHQSAIMQVTDIPAPEIIPQK